MQRNRDHDVHQHEEIHVAEREAGEVSAIAELGARARYPHYPLGDVPADRAVAVVTAEDETHDVVSLERYQERPLRARGMFRLHDHASLVAYVLRHAELGTCLYADVDHQRITAVLDDHEPVEDRGQPGWGEHLAVMKARLSREMQAWRQYHETWLSQPDFAEHVQQHYADIVDPPHAEMLDIAQSLQAARNVDWQSATRLADGQVQLRYEETLEAKAGTRGDLDIPETFTVGLRVFEGLDPVDVEALLQYRIDGSGQLRMRYVLRDLDRHIEREFDAIVDRVADGTGRLVLRGAEPPTSVGRLAE